MKKTVSLILVLVMCMSMCICFSACGNNSIKLTLENYKQYITISASASAQSKEYEGNSFLIGKYAGLDVVTSKYAKNIYGYVYVEGKSQNFNYSDIKVVVEITGKYRHCDLSATKNSSASTLRWETFNLKATCDSVDITGCGSGKGQLPLPAGRGIPVLNYGNGNTRYYEEADFFEYTYKVVSVSGTVTPA